MTEREKAMRTARETCTENAFSLSVSQLGARITAETQTRFVFLKAGALDQSLHPCEPQWSQLTEGFFLSAALFLKEKLTKPWLER